MSEANQKIEVTFYPQRGAVQKWIETDRTREQALQQKIKIIDHFNDCLARKESFQIGTEENFLLIPYPTLRIMTLGIKIMHNNFSSSQI